MAVKKNPKPLRDRDYYMENVKFIRDLVHGYIYLTRFDLELIDTPEFQRLKDVRQVTCQNVYPAARHTRFEHSLGVLELTRQALMNLNQNGILTSPSSREQNIFSEQLIFNAALAALLHDVGHCPFSHMGEVEFDQEEVYRYLCDLIGKCSELKGSSLLKDFRKSKSGSTHEQMSCIVILKKLYNKLSGAGWRDSKSQCNIDFELIIRSIIGLPYDMSTEALFHKNKQKNVIVGLINSKIFDMDKLDYIMRDALSTGIGTPGIDTHRLFNNMYINSEQNYNLVFLHRAVPALQNMVEARDALYMYVYNHHVTVFSDFMYSYIFRRLAHNMEEFQHLVLSSIPEEAVQAWNEACAEDKPASLDEILLNSLYNPITYLGMIPRSYLFSPEAILEQRRSDSDMISLLHDIYFLLSQYGFITEKENEEVKFYLLGAIESQMNSIGIVPKQLKVSENAIKQMIANIRRVFILIDKYQRREFLKPWWKTNFEFTNFIDKNFKGTPAYSRLGEWICHQQDDNPSGDEFRSQLAKHVIYITKELYKLYGGNKIGLLEPLEDGEFFVIERSSRFLDKDAISKLNIALKTNEIQGRSEQKDSVAEEYFIGKLTEIFPQRDYYEIYKQKGFYIFSKPLQEGKGTEQQRERHYHLIEEIFIFVAKQLTQEEEFAFQNRFVTPSKAQIQQNEKESLKKMLTDFATAKGFTKNGEER